MIWQLGRATSKGFSKDGQYGIYNVSAPNAAENKSSKKSYAVPVGGGAAIIISNADSMLSNIKISHDGKYNIFSEEVKIKNVTGEDYVWNPNSKEVVYCTKKKYGTAYTLSTNTDLYSYNIETGKTTNLTQGMMGYDVNPLTQVI